MAPGSRAWHRHVAAWAGAGSLLLCSAAAMGAALPFGWETGPSEPVEAASEGTPATAPTGGAAANASMSTTQPEPAIRQPVATEAQEPGSAILSPFSARADSGDGLVPWQGADTSTASDAHEDGPSGWSIWMALVLIPVAAWALGGLLARSSGRSR